MYVRKIFAQQKTTGEYYQLVQELRQTYPEYHWKYFRMTEASFGKRLSLVRGRIIHPPNHKNPISPGERLAINLRFLATGGSMINVAMSYHIHVSTVSGIRIETLPAIWDCLSPIVLRQPTSDELKFIRPEFATKWNFPNCVSRRGGSVVRALDY
ncbi:hypothetical protein V5799_003139 [Amblyomma americanum]|uniref:Uncharacterized protein n=1 Tax=Amblyomma americanum TaxID=6943 RepID=A0AAQ4D9T9_AMBAM